jgi:hypothetical protein
MERIAMHGLGFLGAVLLLASPAGLAAGVTLPLAATLGSLALGAALLGVAAHLLRRQSLPLAGRHLSALRRRDA